MKNPSENPISAVFGDLTTNQKMSIVNLLFCIASCDSDQPIRAELEYIHVFIETLDLNDDDTMAYFDSQGIQRMITDLQKLDQNQKEYLTYVTFELIECDGRSNNAERKALESIFDKFGIKGQRINEILNKMGINKFI
jgi:uncharacterized tellurite resistance protein B-like protein